jgi:shikimate kinase / 3-dehydroquinate synthase
MRSVVLSGFMATGKSTVGHLVAKELALPFVDTDAVIAEQAGKTVGEVFAGEGEARFRDREAAIIAPLLTDGTPRVVAFGGGSVTIPRIRHLALETATVVTLTASPETIATRATSVAERPNLGARSPVERARDLLALRREAYGESHATIATGGLEPQEIARQVVEIARRDLLAMPLGTRSYAVEIANGAPARLSDAIRSLAPSSLLVVTDTNVRAACGAWLDAALAPHAALPVHVVAIPPGEGHKNIATVTRIWDEALARGVDRKALVLAFGGGVVGDLGGFVASTLLRGVRCVQIPTTLLAMVDSSVGGKTGFDHAQGKNLIGAFFQPSHVVIDLGHLATLPPRELAAGHAEIVKIALACDAKLLAMLESGAALADVVREAVLAKIRVVRDDEREAGIRSLLNLGHTVGHALESFGGFSRWLHGEAVAIGTVVELAACEELGLSPRGTAKRAEALLSGAGLPTRVTTDDLLAAWPHVLADKKRSGDTVAQAVVTGPGEARVQQVALDRLRDAAVLALGSVTS